MRAKSALRVVDTYLTLIEDLDLQVYSGLPQVYALRMAVGAVTDPLPVLRELLSEAGVGPAELTAYANSCVVFNIRAYAGLLARLIRRRMANPPRPDDDDDEVKPLGVGMSEHGPDAPPPGVQYVSPQTAAMLRKLAAFHSRTPAARGYQDIAGDRDIIDSLARMCAVDSFAPYSRWPKCDDAIFDLLRLLDPVFTQYQSNDFKERHVPLLKALFHITCLYYGEVPNQLHRVIQQPTNHPYQISNTTLAALPFPTADLLVKCSEPEAGLISKRGSDYFDALAQYASVTPI